MISAPAAERGTAPWAVPASDSLGRWHRSPIGRLDSVARTAWILALLAFVLFAYVGIRQHDTFHTRARDMGIYAQVIWNTGHGRPFASTLLEDNRLHIAEHVAPVMTLIAPLYALWPDSRLLLLLQQASLAAAGLPIFFWARRRVGDLPALGLLFGYELMPMTSRIAFSEFHPIVLAALPVSLGIKAVLEGKSRAAVAWLLLALLFEEEAAPIVGAAGAYLWLRHRQWSGFGLGALATAYLLAVTLFVMPAFHDRKTLESVGGNRSIDHYEQIQARPSLALEWLTGARGGQAASWLLLPTLGLPLLAPHVLSIALPSFLLLFLTDREGNIAGHWAGAVLPVYWFAAAAGLGVLLRLLLRIRPSLRRPDRLDTVGSGFVMILATVLLVCFLKYSYFPGGGENDTDWLSWTEQEENLAQAVALVPPGIEVDATRRIVPHLAERPDVYQFPSTLYSAPMRPDLRGIDLYLFDLTDSQTRKALDATDQDTVLTRRPRFNIRAWGDSILLLMKDRPVPAHPTDATFGGTLRLYGTDLEQRTGRVRVTAYWESVGKPGAWTRVAELVSADGTVVAGTESAPLDPFLPPSKWDRGQIVAEAIDLRPSPNLPPGEYRLRLGWRDQREQPVTSDRGDMVEVGTVRLP